MPSLADAEIEDQMKVARKEWQDTVVQAKGAASDADLPPGVSRRDFTKWKEQQAVAARRRLAELEDRLGRLQMLRTKLARMKANADDTVQQSHETLGPQGNVMTLPGQAEQSRLQKTEPSAKLGAVNVMGVSQWSTLEDIEGDPDSPVRNDELADDEVPPGQHTRMPAYLPPYRTGMAPPFTPGMSGLRKIIRDEMTAVVSQVVDSRMQKSFDGHLDDTRNCRLPCDLLITTHEYIRVGLAFYSLDLRANVILPSTAIDRTGSLRASSRAQTCIVCCILLLCLT